MGFLRILGIDVALQKFAKRNRKGNFRVVEWYNERSRGVWFVVAKKLDGWKRETLTECKVNENECG